MRNLKGKRLLILGGSLWKDAIKQFAVEHGIVLIATGNDQSAGIFEIADEKYGVNSTDAEAMKMLIKDKNIDGVYMGGAEVVIGEACQYLEELGMPCYCTYKQWNTLQNKKILKNSVFVVGFLLYPNMNSRMEISDFRRMFFLLLPNLLMVAGVVAFLYAMIMVNFNVGIKLLLRILRQEV